MFPLFIEPGIQTRADQLPHIFGNFSLQFKSTLSLHFCYCFQSFFKGFSCHIGTFIFLYINVCSSSVSLHCLPCAIHECRHHFPRAGRGKLLLVLLISLETFPFIIIYYLKIDFVNYFKISHGRNNNNLKLEYYLILLLNHF